MGRAAAVHAIALHPNSSCMRKAALPHSCNSVQPGPASEASSGSPTAVHHPPTHHPALPAAGPGRLLAVTGGDDQALCATLLGCPPGGGCEVLAQARLPNAHSSAIRGVWTDGRLAFSVGLDQRVRAWRLEAAGLNQDPAAPRELQHAAAGGSGAGGLAAGAGGIEVDEGADVESLLVELQQLEAAAGAGRAAAAAGGGAAGTLAVREAGCCVTQVLEPAALDAMPVPVVKGGGAAGGGCGNAAEYLVAVAGRGTEVLRWRCGGSSQAFLA